MVWCGPAHLFPPCSGEGLEWECKLALHVRVCVSLSLLSRVATFGCVCVCSTPPQPCASSRVTCATTAPDTKQVTVYNSVQTKIPRGIFAGRVREVVLWRTRRCFSFWIVTCNVHQGVITKRDAQTTTVLSIQADSLLIPCQQAAQIQAMLFGFERQ